MMPKGYLTVKEASAKSGISGAQLTRLLRLGVIKGERLSLQWLVSVSSLNAYVSNRPKRGRKPS